MRRNEYNELLLERLACVLQKGSLCGSETLEGLMQLGISKEEAMAAVVLSAMGLDADTPAGREIYRGYLPGMLRKCCPEEVEQDPYVLAVGEVEASAGNKRLTMDTLDAYQLFVRQDFEEDLQGRVLPQLGFFDVPVRFPVLLENGLSWMSCEPNEIATLRPLAAQAQGRVVMLGLGLGYYAYHALLNPKVQSVTVVERDKQIIDLFTSALLPFFPRREALTIVQEDAFVFMQRIRENRQADTVLVDLWKSAADGLELYAKMKSMEFCGPVWQYWIEKTMKYYLKEREAW